AYDPRIPPHLRPPGQEKKVTFSPVDSFYYFKNKGVFDKLHMKTFLAKHPNYLLPDNCYPIDFFFDNEFIKTMHEKFPGSDFIERGIAKNNSPSLKEMYYETLIRK